MEERSRESVELGEDLHSSFFHVVLKHGRTVAAVAAAAAATADAVLWWRAGRASSFQYESTEQGLCSPAAAAATLCTVFTPSPNLSGPTVPQSLNRQQSHARRCHLSPSIRETGHRADRPCPPPSPGARRARARVCCLQGSLTPLRRSGAAAYIAASAAVARGRCHGGPTAAETAAVQKILLFMGPQNCTHWSVGCWSAKSPQFPIAKI